MHPHPLDARTVRRTATVRFELVDDGHATIGELHPNNDPVPSITVSTSRAVKREMTGLGLPAGEAGSVNPATDRVRAVLEVAGVGEGPLGVFVFTDAPVVERGAGRSSRDRMLTGSLSDTLALLNVPITRSLSLPPGAPLDSIIGAVLAGSRVNYSGEATGRTIGDAPVTWLRGATTKLAVLTDVARLAGLGAPYADNAGVIRFDTSDASSLPPVVSYWTGENIRSGSLVTAVDPQAPNEFEVTDSSTSAPVSATFHVPDDAPHSFRNRGFTILETVALQSVAGDDRAAAIAYQAYQASQAAYEVFFFDGPADWRHDTLTVVEVNGATCRELSWSLSCGPGMTMSHECARVYA